VEVVASPENAQGLTAALRERDLAGKRVWIPAGNREGTAVRVISPALASAGAEVERFGVYDVQAVSARPERWEPLAARTPGAIVFHSPSAVEAVARETAVPVVRWRGSAVWVAIGETTATRCDRLGGRKVVRCAEPSDPGVVAALASIGTLGVREGRP
jgi:uroporphyrinogen-III synthase